MKTRDDSECEEAANDRIARWAGRWKRSNVQNRCGKTAVHVPGASRRHVQREGNSKKNYMSNRERRDETESVSWDTWKALRVQRAWSKSQHLRSSWTCTQTRLGRPSNNVRKHKWWSLQWRNAPTAWPRTQQTVTWVLQKQKLLPWRLELPKEWWRNIFARIGTWSNSHEPCWQSVCESMGIQERTTCHTSEAHKRGCAMIGLRLAWNRIEKWQSNAKMKQREETWEEVNQQWWRRNETWRQVKSVRSSEEVWDQDTKCPRPQGRVRRITHVFSQVFSTSFFYRDVEWIHVWWQFWRVLYFSEFFTNLVDHDFTEYQITQTLTLSWLHAHLEQTRGIRLFTHATRRSDRQGESDCLITFWSKQENPSFNLLFNAVRMRVMRVRGKRVHGVNPWLMRSMNRLCYDCWYLWYMQYVLGNLKQIDDILGPQMEEEIAEVSKSRWS